MTEFNRYIDWYRAGRLAPYLRGHHDIGATGLSLMEAGQPAGDMSDPPIDELVVGFPIGASPVRIGMFDAGAGRRSGVVRPGTLYSAPPKMATKIYVDEPHQLRWMTLSSALAARATADDALPLGIMYEPDEFIINAVDVLWREAEAGHAISAVFAESVATAVLARLAMLAGRAPSPAARGGLSARALKRVVDHIEAHLSENIALSELAGIAQLSYFHFCRAFKQSTGLTPTAYLQARRVGRAQELLRRDPRARVIDVAISVGYESPAHFARVFRRETGVTPRMWRQMKSS